MSNFKLSRRSLRNLEGVRTELQDVVHIAIELTPVDFGVIEGLRTIERQEELFEAGASQTMNSKHIIGAAVDLLAYIGSRGSWEHVLYNDIADAMKDAAIHVGVGLRWGAAWNIPDITKYPDMPCSAMTESYIDYCRSRNKKPFIDAVHFELV